MSITAHFHFRDSLIGKEIESQLDAIEQTDPNGTKYVVVEKRTGGPIMQVIDPNIAAELIRDKKLFANEVWVFSGSSKQDIEHQIESDKKVASLFPKSEAQEKDSDVPEEQAEKMCQLFYTALRRFSSEYSDIYSANGYDPEHLNDNLTKKFEEFQKVKTSILDFNDSSKKKALFHLRDSDYGPRITLEEYAGNIEKWFQKALGTVELEKKILVRIANLEKLPEDQRLQEFKKINEEIMEHKELHTIGQMGVLNEIHAMFKENEEKEALALTIDAAKKALQQLKT